MSFKFFVFDLVVFFVMCNGNKIVEPITKNITIEPMTRNKTMMEPYIVGGAYADIKRYPHSVYLAAECKDAEVNKFSCGSAILNQYFLLTAAHCTEGCKDNFNISAIAGSANMLQGKYVRKVRRYITHVKYDAGTILNDIALMELRRALTLGPDTQRVIIAPGNLFIDGEIAGWGIVDPKGHEDEHLKMVKQTFLSAARCYEMTGMTGVLCAEAYNYDKDYPSEGDSGSAIVIQNSRQLGLVSFSAEHMPGFTVYTNVSYHYHWIMDKTKELYCYKRG